MRLFLIFVFLSSNMIYAANILVNPSFEYWFDTLGVHLPVGWFTSELLYPNSAIKTTEAHSGNFAVKIIGQDSAAFIITTTVIRPNYSYFFSGYYKTYSAIAGSFILQFTDLFLNPIGSPTLLPAYYATNYRNCSRWIIAPENARFLIVSFTSMPYTSAFIDDVTLEDTAISYLEETPNPKIQLEPVNPLPNPFRKEVKFIINHKDNEIKSLEIYDVGGKLVFLTLTKDKILIWNGRDSKGNEVKKGLYFYHLTIGDKRISQGKICKF